MRLPLAAAIVAVGLLLAGCITPSAVDPQAAPETDEVSQAAFATLRSLLADVPCEASSVELGATSDNLLDVTNMLYDDTTHGEIDVRGDWLLAARYQGGGFEVVSVADPTNPVIASVYQSEEENAQDVKWMPDNRTAVVGVNSHIELVDVRPVIDSGLAPAEMFERGEVLPVLLSKWEYTKSGLTVNMHMLTTARIGGVDYVFVAPNNDDGFWVLKLVGEGADRKLETVGNFYPYVLGGGPLGPHDMSLVWDELTGAPILYVANGFEGWAAYDVSDPASPELLAAVPNLLLAQGYTHTVVGQKVGDRRIVATMAEVGSNVLSIYDATDFATPILLAQWWADKTAPHMPQHNLQLVNGTLYLAHYTYGFFAFDLTTLGGIPLADTATIAPVAHWQPPTPQAADTLGFGNVWDVVLHEGVIYVNEQQHGLSVVGYGCLAPGDPLATSYN